MVFRLTAPTIDLLVKPAGRALFEIGDDKAGVSALVADFDAGDDPLDPAPAFGTVVEGLEAARLAITWCSVEARFGAGFEIGDMAAQRRCRRDTQDEVVPARPAPVDDLGAAIVAVAAQQDLRSGPVGADRPQQAAQKSSDFLALGAFGRAQHGGDEATLAIEHAIGWKPYSS